MAARRSLTVAYILLGILVASHAFAQDPSPANCTTPSHIDLMGWAGVGGFRVPDPLSEFSVIVRDASNNPMADDTVTVDFSGCCNDIRIAIAPFQYYPREGMESLIVRGKTVSGLTDANGVATFRISGGARDIPTPPIPGISVPTVPIDPGCATISAARPGGSYVLLTDGSNNSPVSVAAWDLDGALGGANGINGADLSLMFYDVLSTGAPFLQQRQRSDLNGNGVVNGADASLLFASILLVHGSLANATIMSTCP